MPPFLSLRNFRLGQERIYTADELFTNRKLFEKVVYTPANKCMGELTRRRKDTVLEAKVNELLNNDLPAPFLESPQGVSFRQLATSNYEMRRFFSIIDAIDGLSPLFWEYYEDKFTSNNEWKRSLGKLFFYNGRGKKGGAKIDAVRIIDFNEFNGKKISEVKTLWGESLIEFHHELFANRFKPVHEYYFDASVWFSRHGNNASNYYESFLTLFLRNGVLFENFLLSHEEEGPFIRDVFLPAFLNVWKHTGQKPLIAALEPTDIEGETFWVCHPCDDKPYVMEKLATVGAV